MNVHGNLCLQNIVSNSVAINDLEIKTGDSLQILKDGIVQYSYSLNKDANNELQLSPFNVGTAKYEMFATVPSSYDASDDKHPLVLYIPGFYGRTQNPYTTPFDDLLLNSDDSPFSYTSKRGKNYDPNISFGKYIWVALNIYSDDNTSLNDGYMPTLTINTAIAQCIDYIFSSLKVLTTNTSVCATSIGGQAVIGNLPSKVFDIFSKVVLLDCGPKASSADLKYWNFPSDENEKSFNSSTLRKWYDLYFGEPANTMILSYISSNSLLYDLSEITNFSDYISSKGITVDVSTLDGTNANEAAIKVFAEQSILLFT